MNNSDAHILINESNRSLVYLLSESEYNQPVVIKVLKSDSPTSPEAIRLKNEYEFTKNIKIKGVRKSLNVIKVDQKQALVMEYFPGQPLKQMLGEKLEVIDSIKIAVRIAQIINDVHNEKIIHRNINSENILIAPDTLQVKLIDFNLASRFNIQMAYSGNPEVLPGNLHYISPEQTGRMNRIVDYRSDLYSLGVVFYEMLTGVLPFDSGDPLKLVHAHIAKKPKPIKTLNPDIPPLISDIVEKLLAKNAEDRYQSASGLYADLERCLTYLQEAEGRATPYALSFELGRKDLSKTFRLPQKLYGRSNEIAAMLETFERAAAGSSELFIVTGHPGIGKSSLVAEVYKPITARRGYFITGKFDQLKFNSPYSAFIQAFNQLIESLLNEPEEVLRTYREKILTAAGTAGAVLTEFIPRLSDIIGIQPPVPVLSGRESRFRFNRTFQKFMRAISTAEHPLVFFIDDWQWADTASMGLLKTMFSNEVGSHLLMIMAYRDNEVPDSHPLAFVLADMEKEGIKPNVINLTPLEESDVNILISDTLKRKSEAVWPLSEYVYNITRGNPFFTNQFLNMLHTEGLIVFDHQSGDWRYDITQMDKLNLTDDVVAFLALQIEKLPQEIQDVLELAACIGSRFDLEMLAAVYQKSFDDTSGILQNVLREGLLIPPEEGGKAKTYRFIHDRVQQAAYFFIPYKQKQHTHLIIGRMMLENTQEDELNEKIFEIVHQLNRAIELHTAPNSRIELSRLNFIAGQKAKSAAAFASAWVYFKFSLQLLPQDCWQTMYSFTLDLYKSSVEVSFFSGDSEATHDLVDIVNQEAKALLDTISVNDIKIRILAAESNLEDAIQTGLNFLNLMGLDFPEIINQEDVAAALKELQLAYREKKIKDFIDLPQMTAPLKLAAMQIMESLMAAAFSYSPNLYTLLAFKRISLIFQFGNYPRATFCYASFGAVLCGRMGDIDTGFQFGELSLDLLHRMNAKELLSRVHLLVYGFIFHWKRPLREMLAPMRIGYYTGLETGDLEFAGHNALQYTNYNLYAGIGKDLSNLQTEISAFSKSLYQLKLMTTYQYLQIALQVMHDLREGRSDSRYLRGEYYDERSMLPRHLNAEDRNGLFYLYSYKLLVNYLFGDYKQAAEDAGQAQRYVLSVKGLAVVAVFYLFDSLTGIAVYKEKSTEDANKLLLKIDANQKELKTWAHYAPMNCLHKYDLVEAVRHHALDQKGKAIDYFDRAIAGAKEYGYFRDEALADELAAGFYLDWGKEDIARGHLQSAYHGYRRWGATAKTDQLKRKYPELFSSVLPSQAIHSDSIKQQEFAHRSDDVPGVSLDLLTVIKASQAIAGEIKLERLLRQMLLIMFENAGAQRGALILKEDGEWVIQAQGDVGSDIEVLQAIKLRESTTIATGIVHEVVRARTSLVLDNASAEGDFIYDPYIARNKVESMLCMPLINQGELSGILYLENNLATHVFTAKRLELLNLLSAQMALSLDNARLYQQAQIEIAERKQAEEEIEKLNQELEQRVVKRTQQLEAANQELRAAQDELVKHEKLAVLGQLTAAVSHELRNPLGVIRSSNFYLQRSVKGQNPKTEKHFARIEEQITQCNSIIEDLLEYTQSSSVFSSKTSIGLLMEQVVAQFKETDDIEINLHLPEDLAPMAHDRQKLRRVMINLITNAFQAVSAKAEIAAEQGRSYQPEISIEVNQSVDTQTIVVADNGIGMSAEICRRAFEPLFTTRARGTGIGLSNVKKIIEEHNGGITLESKVDQGTQIKITLPFES